MEGDGDGYFDHRCCADVVGRNHSMRILSTAVLADASGPGLWISNRYHSYFLVDSMYVIPAGIVGYECDDEWHR